MQEIVNSELGNMAYDEKLAVRIRSQFGKVPFIEKKMFGGIGFLVHGNMSVGVYKEDLIVRVEPSKYEKLLKKAHTKVFDITGKPMKGWVMVKPEGCKTAKQLNSWVKEGIEFALTLPPK